MLTKQRTFQICVAWNEPKWSCACFCVKNSKTIELKWVKSVSFNSNWIWRWSRNRQRPRELTSTRFWSSISNLKKHVELEATAFEFLLAVLCFNSIQSLHFFFGVLSAVWLWLLISFEFSFDHRDELNDELYFHNGFNATKKPYWNQRNHLKSYFYPPISCFNLKLPNHHLEINQNLIDILAQMISLQVPLFCQQISLDKLTDKKNCVASS